MSHLFISYAHKDKDILATLLTYLKDNDFTDNQIWYDNIDGGDNWRDEIASALDDAFAVVVIVTKNSMVSHYCTYEWSYALGQDIPLLPLLFDDVPTKDFHAPLAAKQYLDCTNEIDPNLKVTIKEHTSTPPQVKIINQMVHEAIELTHRRYFILTKVGSYRYDSDYIYSDSRVIFYEEANNTLNVLNQLMLDKRFAFSGRQYRYCWRIIQFLEQFSDLRNEDRGHFASETDDSFMNYLAPKFEDEWLPAYKYFAGHEYSWWERTAYRYFKEDISHENIRLSIFGEILRAFPDLHVHDVESLVDSLKYDYKRQQDVDNE